MKGLPIKLLYLGLHNQLKKKFGVGRTISKKEFFCKLGKHYMIPKPLRYVVIKEMEEMGLIKLEKRENLLILDCRWSLESDKDKKMFYQSVGIF